MSEMTFEIAHFIKGQYGAVDAVTLDRWQVEKGQDNVTATVRPSPLIPGRFLFSWYVIPERDES